MKKTSLIGAFVEKTISRTDRDSRAERVRTRALRLENLESRELLSVAPGSELFAAAALAAYESGVERSAVDVLDVSECMLDDSDVAPEQGTGDAPIPTAASSPTPLETPILTVADVSATTVSVSWDAVPNVVRYSLSYKPSNETTWANVNVGTNLSYTVVGLDPTSDYALRLKAIGDGVNYRSVYSDIVNVLRPSELIPLGAPTVSTRGIASDALCVEWDAVAKATGYVVGYKERSADFFTDVSVAATETRLIVDNLDSDTGYYVRVKALGDGVYWSDSPYSAAQTVKTKDASFLSLGEYENLRETYDELLLPESMADVNIVIPDDWTAEAIVDAIDEAQSTPLSDVILLDPEEYCDEVLDLSEVTVTLNVDYLTSGGISFLSRGSDRAQIKVNDSDVTFDALIGLTQFGGLDFVDVNPDVSIYRVTMTTTALGYDSAAIDLQDVGMYAPSGISVGGASHNSTHWAPRVSENPSADDYALLFVGGWNSFLNKERYYLTLADYYCELVEDFSLDPRNIYILYADGDTTGASCNLYIGNDFNKDKSSSYTTSDMSFVAPGTTVLKATGANLTSALAAINSRMTENSHLLSWVWDHGGGKPNPSLYGDEYISGWDDEIDATTVRDAFFQIEQGYATCVFSQCYSGGILDDIFDPATGLLRSVANGYADGYAGSAHFAGAASSNHYETSWSNYVNGEYTGYAQTFKKALRQCSTGVAAFEYTEQIEPFSAVRKPETYNANAGVSTYQIEHPWHAGETFSIFSTSFAQSAPTIATHAETSNAAEWTWSAVPDAVSYTLEYGVVGSPNVITVENIATNSVAVRGLLPETNYAFRVKADNSTYSERAYVWTQAPVLETPSTVVTTELDVVNHYDGLISLREAIGYADSGGTITFDGSLQGKTIALELGQLTTDKSITIDASSLRLTATSEPGLTVSGLGTSRILFLDQAVDVEIDGITFANGYSSNGNGGAIYNSGATLSLNGCVIRDSEASLGGGIFVQGAGGVSATNCLVVGNGASRAGGLGVCGGEVALYNCTVADNSARYGGGVSLDEGSLFNAYNTIIAENNVVKGGADVHLSAAGAVANAFNTLSSYRKWATGVKNVIYSAAKPLFTNAGAGDYTLAASSQAANKGDAQYVATDVDFAGNARVYGGTVDLGAYESAVAGTLTTPTLSLTARTGRTLSFSWNAVPNAERYSLSYKLASETAWTNKNVGTDLSYTITGLEKNSEYEVRLKAIGDGVEYQSVYSKTRLVQTNEAPTPLATPVLTVGAETGSTITVSWNVDANAERYSLSYKPASSEAWTSVNVGTSGSYKISGLEINTEYDLQLKAIGDGVDYKSVYSSIVRAQTNDTPDQSAGPVALVTPVLTVATAPTSLTVSWDVDANAERYSLSYKLASATTWTNKNVGTSASFTIAGLESNVDYDVRLKAIGDGVNYKSVYSATVRVATDATAAALFDLGDDLFDELDEEDLDLLAAGAQSLNPSTRL